MGQSENPVKIVDLSNNGTEWVGLFPDEPSIDVCEIDKSLPVYRSSGYRCVPAGLVTSRSCGHRRYRCGQGGIYPRTGRLLGRLVHKDGEGSQVFRVECPGVCIVSEA